jgi:two-component system, OmpR family, phosphate regulon sensor histidine kinase PhoR
MVFANFVGMKKHAIFIAAALMGIVFIALISVIISFHNRMTSMRKEQFDASVSRSLFRVARAVEMDETLKELKMDLHSIGSQEIDDSLRADDMNDGSIFGDTLATSLRSQKRRQSSSGLISHNATGKGLTLQGRDFRSKYEFSDKMQAELKKRYIYQQQQLNRVIYSILYSSSNTPIEERIDFRKLDNFIRVEFAHNGIDTPYHFTVTNASGRVLYQCPDYTDEGADHSYKQVLMSNNSPSNTAVLTVNFPSIDRYIYKSARYVIVSVVFIVILLAVYVYMIRMVLRQRKLSEMKNDFVSNMTHELKTPVASISLASQMLVDESVPKTPAMTSHLSSVISDETRRLQRLVDRVLQTSLFENKKMSLKHDDLDLNTMADDVASTFALKIEEKGGSITTDLRAENPVITGDEVHITNVLFNLMENAVKYRREDEPLHITVSTENRHDNVVVTIADNGIGIKKENLKKIFEKFYRVHSGNKHDVKGFGLGLAYVRNIVQLHHGHIHAESELGKGTRFIIVLPTVPAGDEDTEGKSHSWLRHRHKD